MSNSRSAPQRMSGVIDVHSHPLLDLGDGRDAGVGAPLSQLPEWSPDDLVRLMDEHAVSMSVLSMPDAACRDEGAVAKDRARRVNEFLAGLVADHPSRFGGLAALPGRNTDDSLAEITYALDELHLDGVSLSTCVDDVYLGDARFDPLLAELDRRGATLFVHPVEAAAARSIDLGLHPSILEFMFDTTRMIVNMILSGALHRFPNVNVIATHGAGALPYLVRRIQVLTQRFGTGGRPAISEQGFLDGVRSFHFDLTAATSDAQLHAMLQYVPADRLLAGFDHPFMPVSTYADSISDLERTPLLADADVTAIARGNAAVLFPSAADRLSQTATMS